MHDKKLYAATRVITPKNIPRGGDTAYLGTKLTVPHKKPKGTELSDQQKQQNRAFSQKRIVVEHAIGRMKCFRILSHRFRNPRRTHSPSSLKMSPLSSTLKPPKLPAADTA
jgi:hypothetical protein